MPDRILIITQPDPTPEEFIAELMADAAAIDPEPVRKLVEGHLGEFRGFTFTDKRRV